MKYILLFLIFFGNQGLAGGTFGGGTPPPGRSKEILLEELMLAAPGNGGIFDLGRGEIGLGVNITLDPKITVSPTQLITQSVLIPYSDFSKLSIGSNVEVTSGIGDLSRNSSFRIMDGDTEGTLNLVDRRLLMRKPIHK